MQENLLLHSPSCFPRLVLSSASSSVNLSDLQVKVRAGKCGALRLYVHELVSVSPSLTNPALFHAYMHSKSLVLAFVFLASHPPCSSLAKKPSMTITVRA